MTRIFSAILLAALWLLTTAVTAAAQNASGLVVSACGALPNQFVASRPAPFTINVNGILCIGASGSVDTTVFRGMPTVTGWSVSSCGNQTFKSGSHGPFTVDLNGNLCD